MLADWQIEAAVQSGEMGIDPYFPEQLQPASYDLLLSEIYRRPLHIPLLTLDCLEIKPGYTELKTADPRTGIELRPGDFILATTIEKIWMPLHYAARVEGKSSLGRIGLAVHITAGFIDPGFEGQVTLEVVNLSPFPVRLRPWQRIAQIAFIPMSATPRVGYEATGHYQGQSGPVESRFRIDPK